MWTTKKNCELACGHLRNAGQIVWTFKKNRGLENSANHWQSVRTGIAASLPHKWFPINVFSIGNATEIASGQRSGILFSRHFFSGAYHVGQQLLKIPHAGDRNNDGAKL